MVGLGKVWCGLVRLGLDNKPKIDLGPGGVRFGKVWYGTVRSGGVR